MKPGMQRDILVAYWLLFDEFEIANGDCDPPGNDTPGSPDPSSKVVTRGADTPAQPNAEETRRR